MSLPDHRGLATWGERRVALDEFRAAAASHGRTLTPSARCEAASIFLSQPADATPVEGPFHKVALCGGVYSNRPALEALLEEASARRVEALYCLGDLGGFGPNPESIRPLLEQGSVRCIQGNYEQALAAGWDDCNCGYADPRDNHYAALSYAYTARCCSAEFKAWMALLPGRRRLRVGRHELLLVHGSPRRVNEFLFHSTSPVSFLEQLLEQNRCDGLLCTHTGLPWQRRLPAGGHAVNVGVIGRPANDGSTAVRYCLLEARGDELAVEILPLAYDHDAQAREMRAEGLPEEFVETILSGWWTTCLEILPARERSLSKY